MPLGRYGVSASLASGEADGSGEARGGEGRVSGTADLPRGAATAIQLKCYLTWGLETGLAVPRRETYLTGETTSLACLV